MEITDKLTLRDYLWIRKLRNENRHLMTGDTRPISLWRQLWFWLHTPPGIRIFLVKYKGDRAGYLLLRELAPECAYITECLAKQHQGFGIGSLLVAYAQTRHQSLIADILQTNQPSIGLHTRNGFVLESQQGEILRYVWSKS